MKSIIILCVIIVMLPCISNADPDKFTRYAMNTPVSIHDFAIQSFNASITPAHKTELSFFEGSNSRRYKDSYSKCSAKGAYIEYDYDSDRYNLEVYFYCSHEISGGEKDLLIDLMDTSMIFLGFKGDKNHKNYRSIFTNGSSTFTTWFSHYGYKRPDEPKKFISEINKKVWIHVKTSGEKECIKQLINDKFYCSGF